MEKTKALIKMIFSCGLFLVLVGLIIIRRDDIKSILDNHVFYNRGDVTLGETNEYYRDYDFQFLQNIDHFDPSNYQELINIYYTVLNAGKTSFTFYCGNEYDNCIEDVQKLANDQELLSTINNYVHPYNGFSHIETEYDSLGRVSISVIKSYDQTQIKMINQQIDILYPALVNNQDSVENNIRSIHDYIITHTRYDSDRSERNISNYQSDIAYGPLFEGYALCGGYTDLMELFLEKMGIKSFKVSSNDHVWNALYINNHWVHLDLTWDDPVSSDGNDYLEYDYFLISTRAIQSQERSQHQFIVEHYPELKEA